MTKDWQDSLRSLLPDGYTPEPEQPAEEQPAPMPRLDVIVDRKRAGKTATIISGFDPDDNRAAELAAMLRKRLATGGSVRGGEILIQGDRAADVLSLLKEKGYKARRI